MIWHWHVLYGHALDWSIEPPEDFLGDRRGDLRAKARCERVLMHDHAFAGALDRRQSPPPAPGRDGSKAQQIAPAGEPVSRLETSMAHCPPGDERELVTRPQTIGASQCQHVVVTGITRATSA